MRVAPTNRFIAAFVSLLLLVAIGPRAGSASAASTSAGRPIPAATAEVDEEALFVARINELRSGLGLTPLTVDSQLVSLARDWAAHLRDQGSLSHTSDLSIGIDNVWTRLGENVGVGPAGSVDAIFDAFVASPSHYANLVRPDYRYVGVGVVHGPDGRIWTSHRFMASSQPAGRPTAPETTLPATAPPEPTQPPATATPTTVPRRPTAPPTPAPAEPARDPSTAPSTAAPSTTTDADPVEPGAPAATTIADDVARVNAELSRAGI